jgi:HAD superfamily hydrolase (TIGR01509 family)
MIKAIIFDSFGVLYPQAMGHFFEKHKELFGSDSTFLDKLNLKIDTGKVSRTEFFIRLGEKIKMPSNAIRDEVNNELIANQRLIEFIKKLKKTYRIGLLSNAGEDEIRIIYRDKIDNLFDEKVISYEVGIVKPDPEIYRICAQRLGVELKECLFVDDSATNIETAKKLGMKTILYINFDDFYRKIKVLSLI